MNISQRLSDENAKGGVEVFFLVPLTHLSHVYRAFSDNSVLGNDGTGFASHIFKGLTNTSEKTMS